MKKKHLFYAAITTLLAGLIIVATLFFTAGATEPPVVDDPTSPIDADKITLTGTAEAEAKITVTGGPYELSPTYADEDGYWEKTVTLIQESTNTYSVTAMGEDGSTSDAVVVVIIEGVEEAQAYEEEYDVDRTAPDSPEVNDVETPIDADSIILSGTAEADAIIIVSGADTAEDEANSSGAFTVEVELEQNAENKFYVSAMDESGNMSSSTKITVVEEGEEDEEEEEDDDTHDSADEDEEISFSDLDGHWAEDYVLALAEDGVVSGYDSGEFGPNDYITRAAITKIALNAFEYETYEADTAFTDLDEDAWYPDYVNSAYAYGIIGGYDDGTFLPGNNVNRAEALKILLEASGIEDLDGASVFIGDEDEWENPFSDVSEDDWFYVYLMEAYTGGVISGYADGTFGGGNLITRAEVCKVVSELLDLEYEIKSTPTI